MLGICARLGYSEDMAVFPRSARRRKAGLLIGAAMLLIAADQPGTPEPVPQRSSTLVVFGADPCPKADGEEIVVCARRPESERFRIPKRLRDQAETGSQSWGSRVATLDEEQRFTRPDSCSPVGSFGQTGCIAAALRQWLADRSAREREAASIP